MECLKCHAEMIPSTDPRFELECAECGNHYVYKDENKTATYFYWLKDIPETKVDN